MSYRIDIYKDNKFYKKADFREKGDKLLIYKWENVDKGSYFFEIKKGVCKKTSLLPYIIFS